MHGNRPFGAFAHVFDSFDPSWQTDHCLGPGSGPTYILLNLTVPHPTPNLPFLQVPHHLKRLQLSLPVFFSIKRSINIHLTWPLSFSPLKLQHQLHSTRLTAIPVWSHRVDCL